MVIKWDSSPVLGSQLVYYIYSKRIREKLMRYIQMYIVYLHSHNTVRRDRIMSLVEANLNVVIFNLNERQPFATIKSFRGVEELLHASKDAGRSVQEKLWLEEKGRTTEGLIDSDPNPCLMFRGLRVFSIWFRSVSLYIYTRVYIFFSFRFFFFFSSLEGCSDIKAHRGETHLHCPCGVEDLSVHNSPPW